MAAHALLADIAATEGSRDPAPDGLIPLTCNEVAPLFNRLVTAPTRRRRGPDLGELATTPPTQSQCRPLPSPARDLITIQDWSTSPGDARGSRAGTCPAPPRRSRSGSCGCWEVG